MPTFTLGVVKVGKGAAPTLPVQVAETVITGVAVPSVPNAEPVASSTWNVLPATGVTTVPPAFGWPPGQPSTVAAGPHSQEKITLFDSRICAGALTRATIEPLSTVLGVPSPSCSTTPQSVAAVGTARLRLPGAPNGGPPAAGVGICVWLVSTPSAVVNWMSV